MTAARRRLRLRAIGMVASTGSPMIRESSRVSMIRGRMRSRPMTKITPRKRAANNATTPFRTGLGENGWVGGSAFSASRRSEPIVASAIVNSLIRSRRA